MEMFQQFNKENGAPPAQNRNAKEHIKTANAPVKIASHITPAQNVNYIKPHPVNITSVIINPYNPMRTPVIQTALLPNIEPSLLNTNMYIQSTPTDAKPVHKITQLNIYNTKNNYHTPPITVQTNSFDVPPLGLPAQQSLIYQNIVVPSKHPTETLGHDNPYQSYSVHDVKYDGDNKYKERLPLYPLQQSSDRNNGYGIGRHDGNRDDDNKYKERLPSYPLQHSRDVNNEFGIDRQEVNRDDDNKYKDRLPSYPPQQSRDRNNEFGRHERNREFRNDEYYKQNNKNKPIKNKDYGRTHYNDHSIERFHEKLETVDDWTRLSRPRENSYVDDYSTPKLVSRHQLPLNDAKKRSRDTDTHFRNFLKTQQKVNDMLERILATKAITDSPRSVETKVL